jgi:hypothetical protein
LTEVALGLIFYIVLWRSLGCKAHGLRHAGRRRKIGQNFMGFKGFVDFADFKGIGHFAVGILKGS